MADLYLFVGTTSGLHRLESDVQRCNWTVSVPNLANSEITGILVDRTSGRVLVATRDPERGARLWRSDDRGETWRETATVPGFPADSRSAVRQIWTMAAGTRPGELLAGVEDAGLFRSEDGGESWEEVVGLRKFLLGGDPAATPARGSLVHSVVVEPTNPVHLWVATSTAGVLRSDDAGETWVAANQGIVPTIPLGALRTHKLIRSPADGQTLYLQHFEGVYRSTVHSDVWERIGEDLPTTFGFPILQTPDGNLFVAPLVSYARRSMPDDRLRLYRSRDGGRSWSPSDHGLPTEPTDGGVLRDSLAADALQPSGVYVGTTDGGVFASTDGGENWRGLPGEYGRITALATLELRSST